MVDVSKGLIIIIILLLIVRKLTFKYDQMRITSKIPKTINKSNKKTIYII